MHLTSGEVVGFEALARGPSGSPLASPLALLAAAREAGRLAELDWLCAALACAAARAARLHPSMSVLLNFEPSTLLTRCPEDLLQATRLAQDQLRIVVEVDEGSLLDNAGRLLRGLRQVREIGWGVAIDNAATSPASLALLPLIGPDVVKLDLRGVRGDARAIAAMSDDARCYQEQSGVPILMMGVEDANDVQVARVAGADYGEGWHFGRPLPLPEDHHVPRFVIPLVARPTLAEETTPFEAVRARKAPAIVERRLLEPLAEHLLGESARNGSASLLFASYGWRHPPDTTTRERLIAVAERAAFALLFEPGTPTETGPTTHVRRLPNASPLSADWNLILLGRHYAGALLARDLGDEGSDPYRRYEYVLTHDRDLVCLAAHSLLAFDNEAPEIEGERMSSSRGMPVGNEPDPTSSSSPETQPGSVSPNGTSNSPFRRRLLERSSGEHVRGRPRPAGRE